MPFYFSRNGYLHSGNSLEGAEPMLNPGKRSAAWGKKKREMLLLYLEEG